MGSRKKNTRKKVRKASPKKGRPFASNAPPPIEPVGVSYRPPRPKPTQTKLDWPSYFPNDLIPQATVILCKAAREHRVPTLEFYAQFVSNLTPYLCAAVRSKHLRADLVILGMGVVLDSLLVYNCDDESRRFRLKQELMVSGEWLKLAEKIARVPSVAATDSSETHLEAEEQEPVRLQARDEASATKRLQGPNRRGRHRTPMWDIYKDAAAHKEANGGSWPQLARKFFPKDYSDDPRRCSDRVRAGVNRVWKAKRS